MFSSRPIILLLVLAVLAGCASSERAAEPSGASSDEAVTTSDANPSTADQDAEDATAVDTASATRAESEAAIGWFHDDASGTAPGLGTERAYRTLLADRSPQQTVTVAIIDSGIDIDHEDLQPVIWVNEDEIPDNGVDDDENGYVDDVHGWNFIGGPDGENVTYDTYEVTRLYRTLHDRFANVDSAAVPPADRDAYQRYQRIRAEFESERQEAQQQYQNVQQAYRAVQASTAALKNHLQTDTLTEQNVAAVTASAPEVQRARDILMYFYQQGLTPADIEEYNEYLRVKIEYHYNPDFNPRPIVGDNYEDKTERIYGNNDVTGPDAEHGTHVAGIVGALRDNGVGMDGIATGVRIMPIRAVPNGDERDKDVANAIRYAVDNGADVINMSFGKGYSPHKEVVDAAVQYADARNVLMVHAAGNDGANTDSTESYPSRQYADGGQATLWIEVGASSSDRGAALAAPFSNYGAETVDVFAPGASIYSTVPGNSYKRSDGTSFAAPMVTGLAALIMAHYPDLSTARVRSLILETAVPYGDTQVTLPGGSQTVPFAQLSRTGAIANAYNALQQAASQPE
jgi:subtilisin family serine protease